VHNPGDYLAMALPVRVRVSRRNCERVWKRKQNLILRMETSRVKETKAGGNARGAP
jgi:hypothetical protein